MNNSKVTACLLALGLCLVSGTVNAKDGESEFTTASFTCIENVGQPERNSPQRLNWSGTLLPTGGITCIGPKPADAACANLSNSVKSVLTAAECVLTESAVVDPFRRTWKLDSFCVGFLHDPMIDLINNACKAMFP